MRQKYTWNFVQINMGIIFCEIRTRNFVSTWLPKGSLLIFFIVKLTSFGKATLFVFLHNFVSCFLFINHFSFMICANLIRFSAFTFLDRNFSTQIYLEKQPEVVYRNQ